MIKIFIGIGIFFLFSFVLAIVVGKGMKYGMGWKNEDD